MNQLAFSKIIILFSLALSSLLFGCGNSNENHNKTTNANATRTIETTPTPPTSAQLADKTKIEEALKKSGFTNITVDPMTTPPTIRGTVPRDKMAEVILIAQMAYGKSVINEVTEK